jgi:hypothetical protein
MRPKIRNFLQITFYSIGFIVISVSVTYAIINDDPGNIVASTSLLIALIALFLTTLSYNQQLDSKLPQIVMDADFKSRYGLVLLSIRNFGEMTAFDIVIEWDRPLINHKGNNIIGEGIDSKLMTIPVLQKGQEIKILIDEVGAFYSKYSDTELHYSGEIKYSISRSKKRNLENYFVLDFSIFRKTLYHETEALKAYYELQKIPDILEKIKDLIKNKGEL